jgi:hypothetical protein
MNCYPDIATRVGENLEQNLLFAHISYPAFFEVFNYIEATFREIKNELLS